VPRLIRDPPALGGDAQPLHRYPKTHIMPILPLPQFEADLEEDRKIYERLKPPTSIVVRFGIMKLVGEFPYSGDAKPGCGSKFVVRTHRGTELAEMLTSTCPNAGCSKSVTRKEMLEYIENSGGRDYPFFSQGKVLRLATAEDLARQAAIDSARPQMARSANAVARSMGLPMKIVDAEPILGEERLTFYFTSEDRIDFRDLVNQLATEHHARIEMRQVGARDEARLVADYEKCGQHCCCKQFLKVLKPISMKSAKIQKATLDPLKISGRCGRLMCCLRYEDSTYDELRARLPKKKTRVKTPDGWGTVLDTQILTQLALVRLDSNGEDVAIPIENFIKDGETPPPPPAPPEYGQQGAGGRDQGGRRGGPAGPGRDRRGGPASGPRPAGSQPAQAQRGDQGSQSPDQPLEQPAPADRGDRPGRDRRDGGGQGDRGGRRDRGRGGQPGGDPSRGQGRQGGQQQQGGRGPRPQPTGSPAGPANDRPIDDSGAIPSDGPDDGDFMPDEPGAPGMPGSPEAALGPDGQPRKKRRRRRRRRGGGGGGGPGGQGGGPAPEGGPPPVDA
jgi:cell fate regulator YaaT (PSP1 superfamily)